VALTSAPLSPRSTISYLKLLPLKNRLVMVEKIQESVSSEGFGRDINEKCLENRGVSGDLPPPGGPHAQIRMVFSTSFQTKDLRS